MKHLVSWRKDTRKRVTETVYGPSGKISYMSLWLNRDFQWSMWQSPSESKKKLFPTATHSFFSCVVMCTHT